VGEDHLGRKTGPVLQAVGVGFTESKQSLKERGYCIGTELEEKMKYLRPTHGRTPSRTGAPSALKATSWSMPARTLRLPAFLPFFT
jgi:hypothetical protein